MRKFGGTLGGSHLLVHLYKDTVEFIRKDAISFTIIDFDKYLPMYDKFTSENAAVMVCPTCDSHVTEFQLNVATIDIHQLTPKKILEYSELDITQIPIRTIGSAKSIDTSDPVVFECPYCLTRNRFRTYEDL